MPTTKPVAVKQLKLDLRNFRTVTQKNENDAIHALISIHPDWFWALTESLLDDGYHPTENIIVLEGGKDGQELIVKEGNRRIAALKLIHGYVKRGQFAVPAHIESKIASLSQTWKTANNAVPCAVYGSSEADVVDKVVTLTHGKAEQAGRDKWNAIARARHNRDMSGASEPALDLLEKYLKHGKNLTPQQAERWAGDYPLTVLEEAVKRLASRFGVASSRELADQYPTGLSKKAILEDILRDIGVGNLDFEIIRDKNEDFAKTKYGLDVPSGAPSASGGAGGTSTTTTGGAHPTGSAAKKTKAVSADDPRAVRRALRKFHPKGNNREKLVTLLNEARTLKLEKHPHSFCFLLRSMFEISAKAYCTDHAASGGLAATKASGEDRALVDVLRDVTKHLTKNNTDKNMKKALHGAMTELAKSEGILSVTSMNQLIHNPKFSVKETHISTLFGNIFPLLEAMNR
jgi:hypothetical protein